MTKLKIKKDDMVLVIAGNSKDKKDQNGKYPAPHKVLKVLVKEQRAIVKMEAPIHISNLNVVDPKTGKPTRIGRRLNENGKLVRYSKKSGEEIK